MGFERALKLANELSSDMSCRDFEKCVSVVHGDGSHFFFRHADPRLVMINGIKFLIVMTEHNGDHAFCVEDLEHYNAFDYEKIEWEEAEEEEGDKVVDYDDMDFVCGLVKEIVSGYLYISPESVVDTITRRYPTEEMTVRKAIMKLLEDKKIKFNLDWKLEYMVDRNLSTREDYQACFSQVLGNPPVGDNGDDDEELNK